MSFSDFMQQNLLWHVLSVAAIGGTIAWSVARRLHPGWVFNIAGVFISALLALLISALGVAAWLYAWGGTEAFGLSVRTEEMAYLVELGLEFGLLGIFTSTLTFIAGRFRRCPRSTPI